MRLQAESGVDDYKLANIVFRTGGQLDGHFFVAAPAPAAAWVIFNKNNVLKPMSLSTLERRSTAQSPSAGAIILIHIRQGAQRHRLEDLVFIEDNPGSCWCESSYKEVAIELSAKSEDADGQLVVHHTTLILQLHVCL